MSGARYPTQARLRLENFVAESGASVNENGGIYISGEAYGYAKTLEVAAVYRETSFHSPSSNINAIAKQCHVSWHFVAKICAKIIANGGVICPSEISKNKNVPRGAGSKTLDQFDQFVLLHLMMEDPSRSRSSYRLWLFEYTGTVVSKQTISKFFLTAFPIKGGFVKPNLVPYDNFFPENEARAYE